MSPGLKGQHHQLIISLTTYFNVIPECTPSDQNFNALYIYFSSQQPWNFLLTNTHIYICPMTIYIFHLGTAHIAQSSDNTTSLCLFIDTGHSQYTIFFSRFKSVNNTSINSSSNYQLGAPSLLAVLHPSQE